MKPARQDALCEILLVGVSLAYILLCPYAKVEESFSLHAIHDIQERGVHLDAVQDYDHKTFTGPLPRSFIGALTVAGASYPLRRLAALLHLETPLVKLILIRSTLAVSNSLCLIFLARRLKDTFNARACRQFLFLTACQFHIPFWMGRTIPNMFAFGPVQIALALMLLPKQRMTRRWSRPDVLMGLAILTSLTIILRLELAALLIPLAIQAWWYDRVDLLEGGFAVGFSALASLSVTLSVDSHFWGDSVWPEFASLLYNVVDGKSVDWGTSPWYTYFFVSLPWMMLFAYPFLFLGLLMRPLARRFAFSMLVYVAVMSLLEHKEWRFIVYVVPCFNVIALAGISELRRSRRQTARTLFAMTCVISLMATIPLAAVSSYNYPGGHALVQMNKIMRAEHCSPTNTTVHLDVYTCSNGATNLLHDAGLARYDKTEGLSLGEYADYAYIITEEPQQHVDDFDVIRPVKGWAGITMQLAQYRQALRARSLGILARHPQESLWDWSQRLLPVRPRVTDKVYIMKNRQR